MTKYPIDPLTKLVTENLPERMSLDFIRNGGRGIIIPTNDLSEIEISEVKKGHAYPDYGLDIDIEDRGRMGLEVSFDILTKYGPIYHALVDKGNPDPVILKCDSKDRYINEPWACRVRKGYKLRFYRGFRHLFDTVRRDTWDPEDIKVVSLTMELDKSLTIKEYPKYYPLWFLCNQVTRENLEEGDESYKRSHKIAEQNKELYTPEIIKATKWDTYRTKNNCFKEKGLPKLTPTLFRDIVRLYRDFSIEGFELTFKEFKKLTRR